MTAHPIHPQPDPRDAPIFERIAIALERIALALEQGEPRIQTEAPSPASLLRDLRKAIRDGDPALGTRLLDDFRFENPDAPEIAAITEELAAARVIAIDDHRKRLDAARSTNDPEGVLTARNSLAELLEPNERDPLDADVVKWLMGVLMRRMRTGTVRPDVAALAARVAESFPHRSEGASLRASLPTLRRSAGLCARCAGPYDGVEDACPKCLTGIPKIADLPESPVPPA